LLPGNNIVGPKSLALVCIPDFSPGCFKKFIFTFEYLFQLAVFLKTMCIKTQVVVGDIQCEVACWFNSYCMKKIP